MFRGKLELKRKTPKPRGRHLIKVCCGTYCNWDETRVLDSVERTLGINAGETTSDGKFTLEVVNCLNHSNEGPVIEIDGQCYERVSPDDIKKRFQAMTSRRKKD